MLYSCCDLASWSWARISPICLRVCVTGSTLLPRHDVWPAAKQHVGMCVHFSLSFGSFGPRAKERIEPNLADELFPELLPNSYVCHPLLFYLSYLCDHSACQRAGGLELMLKSEYWNHSQGTTKTNTKHPSVLCMIVLILIHLLDQILYLPACLWFDRCLLLLAIHYRLHDGNKRIVA